MAHRAKFKNLRATVIWIFASIWLAMLIAITRSHYIYGPPEGYDPGAILALLVFLWMMGVGLAGLAIAKPCFVVTIEDTKNARMVWIYPCWVVKRNISKDQLGIAQVLKERDIDDENYYVARVRTADDSSFDLKEGPDLLACEQACLKFNKAVFGDRFET